MIVGAFLAETASAVNNKLAVSGGVLYRFAVEERPVGPVPARAADAG